LLLLRASFSASKTDARRSSICKDNPMLDKFDSLHRKGICMISNTGLSDIQWIHASLPVRNGGLGIKRVTSHAPSAVWASVTRTRDHHDKILARDYPLTDFSVDLVLACWTSRHNSVSPEGPDAAIQRVWDMPSIDAGISMLETSMPEKHHRARLFALDRHRTAVIGCMPTAFCLQLMDGFRDWSSRHWSAVGSQIMSTSSVPLWR